MHPASPPPRGWPPPGAAAAAPIGGSTRSSRSCLLQCECVNRRRRVSCLAHPSAGTTRRRGTGCVCSGGRRRPGAVASRGPGACAHLSGARLAAASAVVNCLRSRGLSRLPLRSDRDLPSRSSTVIVSSVPDARGRRGVSKAVRGEPGARGASLALRDKLASPRSFV